MEVCQELGFRGTSPCLTGRHYSCLSCPKRTHGLRNRASDQQVSRCEHLRELVWNPTPLAHPNQEPGRQALHCECNRPLPGCSLCFLLVVEGVSSQLPAVATMPVADCHFNPASPLPAPATTSDGLLFPWSFKSKQMLSSVSCPDRGVYSKQPKSKTLARALDQLPGFQIPHGTTQQEADTSSVPCKPGPPAAP